MLKKIVELIKKNPVISIVLLCIATLLYFKITNNIEINNLKSRYESVIESQKQEFEVVINKKTKEVSFQQKQLEYEKELSKILYKEALEKLKEELQTESKNIRQLIAVKYASSNNGSTEVVKETYIVDKTDSFANYQFDWTDGFLSQTVSVNKKKAFVDYTYSDSIRVAGFVKKKGFLGLGKPDYMVDVKFANPKTKVQEMQSVKFDKNPRARFSIGIGGGYYYFPTTNSFGPGVGITVQRNLINIR